MKKFLSISTALVTVAASIFSFSGCGQSNIVQEISYTATDSSNILNKYEFEGKIQNGTKLIVAENQVLLVVKNDKIVDSFTAGEHIVNDDNAKSFASSEVYFLDNTPQNDLSWSMTEPISYNTTMYGDLEIIGHGNYSYSFDNEVDFVEAYLSSDFEGSASKYIANTITDTVKHIISTTDVNDYYVSYANLEKENIQNNLPDNGVNLTLLSYTIGYTEESKQKINAINTENVLGYTIEVTTAPPTTAPIKYENTITFKAEVYLLTKEEDGRHTPIFKNYKPELVINGNKVMSTCTSLDGKEMVMPGEDALITFEIDSSIEMNVGDEITMREGGRVIGTGVVTEIL